MALEVDWQILTTICRSHESRHLDRCRQGVWEALGAFGTDQLISSSLAGLLYLHARTFRRPRCVTLGRPIKKGLAMEEMSIRCRRVEGLCELHAAASAAPLRVAVAVPIETNRPSMIGCRTRGQRPQCPQGCPDSSSVGPGARLQGLRCLVQRTSSQYLVGVTPCPRPGLSWSGSSTRWHGGGAHMHAGWQLTTAGSLTKRVELIKRAVFHAARLLRILN